MILKHRKIIKKATYLSEEAWEELKAKWMSDSITYTFEALSVAYGIAHATIKRRSKKEGWNEQRENVLLKAKEKIRLTVVEMFTKAGLPPQKLIELIVQGAKATYKLQNINKIYEGYMHTAPWGKGGTGKRTLKLKPFSLVTTTEVIDNDNTREYRHMAVQLLGLYAPPKQAVPSDSGNDAEKIPIITRIGKVESK